MARKLDTLTVTLVVNGSRVPKLEVLARKLEEDFGTVTIFISENVKNTNVIFGDGAKLVWGREQKQNLGTFEAVVSPLSFCKSTTKCVMRYTTKFARFCLTMTAI